MCVVSFSIHHFLTFQVSILTRLLGTIRYTTNCFEEAVELIDRGLIDVKSLVSHAFNFNDSLSAFETVYNLEDKQGRKLLKTVILHGDATGA
jgi:threonine dehydrogenase-like Zn-dependent dehydrogenase